MAKVFYENKYILTKKLFKQYCKECYKKSRKRTQVLSLICAIVTFVLAALVLIIWNKTRLSMALGIVALYFVMMIFWGYSFSEWFNYRGMQKDYGENIVTIMEFLPLQVNVKMGKTSFSFKYTSITKAYETEDTLILILQAKGMIEHGQLVFKRGFKNHPDLEDFKKFINEKSGNEIFGGE